MAGLLTADWVAKLPMDVITRVGQRHGVDPFLVAAICMQESGCRKFAQRFEPGYPWIFQAAAFARKLGSSLETEINGQQTSYGLMQVMGAVLREAGFEGWFGQAYDVELNVGYGTKHLAKFLKRYDTPEAIASYNAGRPVYLKGTKTLKNQTYVDSVLRYWSEASRGAKKNA